jgi:sigma-B regulation protein RsbU (phosphoserine phosphatase)
VSALFFSKRLVTPINVMTKQVKEISGDNIHFEMDDIYRTGDEIETLAGSFEGLTDQLSNYVDEVAKISAEKERLSSEMNVARKIQASMLPRIFPAFPERDEFDLYACMIPAKEVGGDFYDYFFTDKDHLAIIIGDVSGKGISAALFMVMTKHILQSQVVTRGNDVTGAMKVVNDLLTKDNVANMFVTIWLGVLTISTGKLVFVNAGHEYAALCRKGENFTADKDKHSPPVAASGRTEFKDNEITLQPGDTIYLYTDGITEAINNDTEMFGRDRMLEVLNQNKGDGTRELDEKVRSSIAGFVGDENQFDDMTTLCIRYYGPKEA